MPKVNRRGAEIVGSMIVTVAVLFGLQYWYGTASALREAQLVSTAAAEATRELEAAQRQKCATGPLPIEQAMRRFASSDRAALALIRPEMSTDPGPAAGWMHHPSYEAIGEMPPFVPPPPPEPEPADEETAAPAPSPTMAPTPPQPAAAGAP
jgi:hypothetical protein